MAITGQQFNEIIKYPFQDPKWFSKLCLQGAVLMLLTFFFIGIPFAIGYMIRCIQKGISGEQTLPDWSEWGLFWKLGWKAFAVNITYLAPIFLLWGIISVFILIMALLGSSQSDLEEIVGVIAVFVGIIGYGITMIYSLAMMFFQPALFTAVALGRTYRQSIQLKTIWPYVKTNAVNIIIGVAIVYLAGMIASVGMFAFFIGIFFTVGYSYAVGGYTYGSIYRQSSIKL